MSMSIHRLLSRTTAKAWGFGLALAVCIGCSSAPVAVEPLPPHYKAKTLGDVAAVAGTYQPVDRLAADALVSTGDSRRPTYVKTANTPLKKPLNVLVLSGGGQYAAFAGGVLAGWTATGKRPDFDVVTGVSSGAFLSVYAYLGPKYDPAIQRQTDLKTSDVFKYRPLVYWYRHDSIGSSEPLQRLIENELNDECLADIRAAHKAGRRLFIGTMNQQTRRLIIWDVGAVACSGQPDADQLVRKIVVASSSIPGVVPAVDFEVEVNGQRFHEPHVDGGAISQAFVRFGPEIPEFDPAHPDKKWLAGSNLYVIAGGKLYADAVEGKMGLLKRTTSSISGTLYALYRSDLWRIYSLCAASGMNFHHIAVPEEAKVAPSSIDFNQQMMHDLFDLGRNMGQRGGFWRQTPPGYEDGETENPRAGVHFTIR